MMGKKSQQPQNSEKFTKSKTLLAGAHANNVVYLEDRRLEMFRFTRTK